MNKPREGTREYIVSAHAREILYENFYGELEGSIPTAAPIKPDSPQCKEINLAIRHALASIAKTYPEMIAAHPNRPLRDLIDLNYYKLWGETREIIKHTSLRNCIINQYHANHLYTNAKAPQGMFFGTQEVKKILSVFGAEVSQLAGGKPVPDLTAPDFSRALFKLVKNMYQERREEVLARPNAKINKNI